MNIKILILLICFPFLSFSQLNCKNKTNSDGSKTSNCFHKNGKISTVETWDKEKRWGKIIGYNFSGNQLFEYELRTFAGHASVDVKYFPNGQVSSLYYSSAPDGGIQFYRYRHKFDESGKQTEFYDESHPSELPTIFYKFPDTLKKPVVIPKKPEIKKQEVVECAIPFVTEFVIINETRKAVKIKLKAQKNHYILLKDIDTILKPKETLVVKSIMLAQMFLAQESAYVPEFVKANHPRLRAKQKFKFILAKPIESANKKTYAWHIIKD
ncbi:MAG: hypothetical protein V4622_14385 [Bacteroidota bacterium]